MVVVDFAACNLLSMAFLLPETLRRVDNLQAIKAMMHQQEDTNEDDEKSNLSHSGDEEDQRSSSEGSLSEKRERKYDQQQQQQQQAEGISDTELKNRYKFKQTVSCSLHKFPFRR